MQVSVSGENVLIHDAVYLSIYPSPPPYPEGKVETI
jgi:hypothetical protein